MFVSDDGWMRSMPFDWGELDWRWMMSRGKMMCRGDNGENGREGCFGFVFGPRDVRKVSVGCTGMGRCWLKGV